MRGSAGAYGSRDRLAAAAMLREEICGPVKQRVEHSGDAANPVVLEIHTLAGGDEP